MSFSNPGQPLSSPKSFGKYTLLSQLVSGGMGQLFFAKQQGPGGFEKECVVKRMLPQFSDDQQAIQLFLEEARLLAKISHPHVAHVFDFGEWEGNYYYAMDYIPGYDVDQILKQEKSKGENALPWPIAARIIADAASGLSSIHQLKNSQGQSLSLVHRDICPSNIRVSTEGITKILDLGLVQNKDAKTLPTEGIEGTWQGRLFYMSPEQIKGIELDSRSDIFSLGVVLFELLYGVRPFPAEGIGNLTLQILHIEPQFPEINKEDTQIHTNDLYPKIPHSLQKLVSQTLSKTKEARTPSAKALVASLEQIFVQEHIFCTSAQVENYLAVLFSDQPSTSSQQNHYFEYTQNSSNALPSTQTISDLSKSSIPLESVDSTLVTTKNAEKNQKQNYASTTSNSISSTSNVTSSVDSNFAGSSSPKPSSPSSESSTTSLTEEDLELNKLPTSAWIKRILWVTCFILSVGVAILVGILIKTFFLQQPEVPAVTEPKNVLPAEPNLSVIEGGIMKEAPFLRLPKQTEGQAGYAIALPNEVIPAPLPSETPEEDPLSEEKKKALLFGEDQPSVNPNVPVGPTVPTPSPPTQPGNPPVENSVNNPNSPDKLGDKPGDKPTDKPSTPEKTTVDKQPDMTNPEKRPESVIPQAKPAEQPSVPLLKPTEVPLEKPEVKPSDQKPNKTPDKSEDKPKETSIDHGNQLPLPGINPNEPAPKPESPSKPIDKPAPAEKPTEEKPANTPVPPSEQAPNTAPATPHPEENHSTDKS